MRYKTLLPLTRALVKRYRCLTCFFIELPNNYPALGSQMVRQTTIRLLGVLIILASGMLAGIRLLGKWSQLLEPFA